MVNGSKTAPMVEVFTIITMEQNMTENGMKIVSMVKASKLGLMEPRTKASISLEKSTEVVASNGRNCLLPSTYFLINLLLPFFSQY